MSTSNGTLPTTEYLLTDPWVKNLPAFVLAKVKSIMESRRDRGEDVDLPDEDSLCYAEAQGCLISSIEDITNSVKIWIEDLGYPVHFVHPGGSSTWIRLENPLSFELIPDQLLPPMSKCSPSSWWIVSNTGDEIWPRVVKVYIIAEDQVTEAFPNLR